MALTAVVLSGGGSRGDFELGALRLLYERGIRPDIICGVSVGSINAAKLAEGDDAANSSRGFAGLNGIWASLQRNHDMWEFADPQAGPALWEGLNGGTPSMSDLGNALGSIAKNQGVSAAAARSVLNLEPIRRRLATDLQPALVAASGIKLRLGTVSLNTGRLHFIGEDGVVYEADGTTRVCSEVPGPRPANVQKQIDDLRREIDRETDPNTKRRLASKLASLQKSPRPMQTVPVVADLRDAVIASASIPMFFPPVALPAPNPNMMAADQLGWFVDGGVREVIPVRVALSLGATEVYAISASPPGSVLKPGQKPTDFATANMFDIALRGLVDIAIDEVDAGDMPASGELPAGVTLHRIAPAAVRTHLHDMVTVDPGLIELSADYGYMRAADVLDGKDLNSGPAQAAIAVTYLRREKWWLENIREGQECPDTDHRPATGKHDTSVQPRLDQIATEIAAKVDERITAGYVTPTEADTFWHTTLEGHPWVPGVANLPAYDAQVVTMNAPAMVAPGATFTVEVTYRNTGSQTWTNTGSNPVRLGSQDRQDNNSWGTNRIPLPQPQVLPGASVTFTFTLNALGAPGNRGCNWQLVHEGASWFGAEATSQVRVDTAVPCAQLAAAIVAKNAAIVDAAPEPGDPQRVRALARVKVLTAERDALRDRARDQGCPTIP